MRVDAKFDESDRVLPDVPEAPFWMVKSLEEMTQIEWESLCDGCGRCCLNKLEDWDTGEIVWTDVACRLLDCETCRCTDYANRSEQVPDCIPLTPQKVRELTWLPPTCAYRLVADGDPLYWWHPLVSGDPRTVHDAGVSVRGRVRDEAGMDVEEYADHVVSWPGEVVDAVADGHQRVAALSGRGD